MNCMWSSWGLWKPCSKSCGIGFRERKRTKSPPAKYGGKDCAGSNRGRVRCNRRRCPGINVRHFMFCN